jgi:hypothetical protein
MILNEKMAYDKKTAFAFFYCLASLINITLFSGNFILPRSGKLIAEFKLSPCAHLALKYPQFLLKPHCHNLKTAKRKNCAVLFIRGLQ